MAPNKGHIQVQAHQTNSGSRLSHSLRETKTGRHVLTATVFSSAEAFNSPAEQVLTRSFNIIKICNSRSLIPPHSHTHTYTFREEGAGRKAENTKLLRLIGNNVLWYRCREILSISLLAVYSLQGRSYFPFYTFTFYQRTQMCLVSEAWKSSVII